MRTIETTATVTPEGTLVIPVPLDVVAGSHQVVVVIEEQVPAEADSEELNGDESLPVHDLGVWPEGLSLKRTNLYDEWGR